MLWNHHILSCGTRIHVFDVLSCDIFSKLLAAALRDNRMP
jgi:hypothetical protein